MKFALILAATLSLLSSAAARAEPWNVGPPVGAATPPLHATDLKGAPVSLRELSGRNGLVLVFFRSAKWCPYCQKQLMDLKDAPAALDQRGYRLAAISYDPAEVLSAFATRWRIPYALLSDTNSVTIDAWKLRDVRYKPGTFAWGVPYASIYVISPKGVLKAKLAEEDYKTRPPLSAVLAAIDGLPKGR